MSERIHDIGDRPNISWQQRMEMGSFEPHPIEIPVPDHYQEPTAMEITKNDQTNRTTIVDFAIPATSQAME